ncbi:MAG TPA: hypothetical protein VGD60_13055, partial [Candidatus Acidoferrales bacterium]
GTAAPASADPLGVSYTITGSAGDWTLDFSVTNNIVGAPNQDFYFFGVLLPGGSITGTPPAFGVFSTVFNPSIDFGGSNTNYNDNWLGNVGGPAGFPGMTISGFDVTLTSASAPTSVQWFGFSEDTNFLPTYTGGGNFNTTGSQSFNAAVSPGFEGLAVGTPTQTASESSTLGLLVAGLLAFAGLKKIFS